MYILLVGPGEASVEAMSLMDQAGLAYSPLVINPSTNPEQSIWDEMGYERPALLQTKDNIEEEGKIRVLIGLEKIKNYLVEKIQNDAKN